MILTIYLKNRQKQIVNSTDAVLSDTKGRRLTADKIKEKMNTTARAIAGRNYLNHKFSFN